jgi:hypothetical protein
MASGRRAWSSPSFPRSGVAGEVVEVFRPVLLSVLASLSGRGGKGRSRWGVVLRLLVAVVVFFDWMSLAGRGGEGSRRLKLCRVAVEDDDDAAGVGKVEEGWLGGGGAAAVSVHCLQFRRGRVGVR